MMGTSGCHLFLFAVFRTFLLAFHPSPWRHSSLSARFSLFLFFFVTFLYRILLCCLIIFQVFQVHLPISPCHMLLPAHVTHSSEPYPFTLLTASGSHYASLSCFFIPVLPVFRTKDFPSKPFLTQRHFPHHTLFPSLPPRSEGLI